MSQSRYYRALESAQQLLATRPAASAIERTRLLQEFIDSVSSDQAAATGWACRSGCAHCCRHPVGVTLPEVIVLAEAVRALAEPRRTELCRAVAAAELASRELPWPALAESPCPLLDERSCCSVYQDRPLPCRAFGSTDERACADPRRSAGVPFDRTAFDSGLAAVATLADGAGHRELRSALGAVLAVAPEDAARAFQRAQQPPQAQASPRVPRTCEARSSPH